MTEIPQDPTNELLKKIVLESWKHGKGEQQRLGLEIVPPNSEMEVAAGSYKVIYDYLSVKSTT